MLRESSASTEKSRNNSCSEHKTVLLLLIVRDARCDVPGQSSRFARLGNNNIYPGGTSKSADTAAALGGENTWSLESWIGHCTVHLRCHRQYCILLEQEQRKDYNPSLHWVRVHPKSASSPVTTDKWCQECLAEPIGNFPNWACVWWSLR